MSNDSESQGAGLERGRMEEASDALKIRAEGVIPNSPDYFPKRTENEPNRREKKKKKK
jgi:hypothetical protein